MESETTAKNRKKKKKKSRNSKKQPIPLVKGATASSLAKKKSDELRSSSKPSGKRKRRRKSSSSSSSNNDTNGGGDDQPPLFANTAESLAVISKFHTLNKRLEQIRNDATLSTTEKARKTKAVEKEQEAMGGLERYQKASIYGAKSSKFVCADWVVPLLKPNPSASSSNDNDKRGRRLRILDVGAIDNQYLGHDDWLDAVPIDLHGGQHESVLQVDFFDYAHAYCTGTDPSTITTTTAQKGATKTKPKPKPPPNPFDAIVMSLVLNFQGDPRKRGDMLALAADPRLLRDNGMLFVALPAASLDNSRYCDLERFVEVVTNPLFGFQKIEQKRSSKLILVAFCKTTTTKSTTATQHSTKKKKQQQQQQQCCYDASRKTFDYGDHEMKRLQPAKPGTKRNNFAIILKSSHDRT